VQKLIPKLQSPGYEETEDQSEVTDQVRRARQEQERRDPHGPMPSGPQPDMPFQPRPLPGMAQPRPLPVGDFPPPGFDDEYDMNRPPGRAFPGGRQPFGIGHDDLNPPGLGPNDPLRGSFVGGGLPRPGGGAGMHPTFDDPLFTGEGGYGGQGGYDPQVPPGARWDPTGPGFGPGRRGPFGGSGGQGGGFGGGFGGGDII
jgi:hypothetical protein